MLKAYDVIWNAMPTETVVIAAETASKARYEAYLLVSDLQRTTRIIDFRVVRAPRYDELATKPGRVFQSDTFEPINY